MTVNACIQQIKQIMAKFTFLRLLILSLILFVIYLHKLYQDCNAVSTYYYNNDFYFFIISIVSLIAPSILCSFYLVGKSLLKDDEIDQCKLFTEALNGLLLIPWQMKRLEYFLNEVTIC